MNVNPSTLKELLDTLIDPKVREELCQNPETKKLLEKLEEECCTTIPQQENIMSTSIKCTKCGAELVEHVDSLADFRTGHGGVAVDFGDQPIRAVCSNGACGAAFDLTIGVTNVHELPSNWKELMDKEAHGLEVPAGWDKA